MEALKKETVHMKDRDNVEKIISQLIKDGSSKLQVISDFDNTLSRVHKDGVKCATTYGTLDESHLTSEDYKYQIASLNDYYRAMEVDPNLSKNEKKTYMIEWYTKAHDLLPSTGVSKNQLTEMVEASNLCLRDGCESLFKLLHKLNVPLLIFSAGIGDILKEVLQQRNLLLPNMKIVANFMHFDEKNKVLGFKGDLIHTFNKNRSSMKNSDYFSTLKERSNVILLGDTLGDLDMYEGAENVNVMLTIGFLNHRIEENLKVYLDSFDIVLTDDQTVDVVIGLLESML